MTVDLWMPYMPMLVSITLTLTQGHSGRQRQNISVECSATIKQAISIKLARTVGHFCLPHLDCANVYMD